MKSAWFRCAAVQCLCLMVMPAAWADGPKEPIPPITPSDRVAAFPDVAGHPAHDQSIHSYFLMNRLETTGEGPDTDFEWEGQGWIGTDSERAWIRSEGTREAGETRASDLEVMYGRAFARWWDAVVGMRQDFDPGDPQTFAAIGVAGLAPQWFEIEATAYLGEAGQAAARVEAEYELLLTNRLILQPLVEINVYKEDDIERQIGSGLSSLEAGLRLRYEIKRQFAPYIGIVGDWAYGDTADLRRAAGQDTRDIRWVGGFRVWF